MQAVVISPYSGMQAVCKSRASFLNLRRRVLNTRASFNKTQLTSKAQLSAYLLAENSGDPLNIMKMMNFAPIYFVNS